MFSEVRLDFAARRWPQLGNFARGLTNYAGAELAGRVVRLLTTVIIARRLAPDIVGEAALVLTIFEIVGVLERTGTGQRIIVSTPGELARTCNAAQYLYQRWTVLLIGAQLLVALGLARWFGRPLAGELLAALSLVYPFMAFGHVQYHLAMRAGFTGRLARISAVQNIVDQLLTAVLLLAWPSPWSVVLPKLLTAPLWLVMARRAHPWRRDPSAGQPALRGLVRFSVSILAAEAMSTLRTQGDNLIIVAMMGTRALGIYYFAFNAGLGIVSSLVGAFRAVAFPMLSGARRGRERVAALRRIALLGGALFVPLVILQSLAAPRYVPIVFGRHWAFAAPLIATLCLAGLPLFGAALMTSWLRAEARVSADAASSAISCSGALGGLYLGARYGSLREAALGLVVGQSLAFAFNASRVFGVALRGPRLSPPPIETVERNFA